MFVLSVFPISPVSHVLAVMYCLSLMSYPVCVSSTYNVMSCESVHSVFSVSLYQISLPAPQVRGSYSVLLTI